MVRALAVVAALASASAFVGPVAERARLTRHRGGGYSLDDVPISSPVTPIGNYLLVEVQKTSDESASGLILTGKDKEKLPRGVVVACGEGRTHTLTGAKFPMAVQVGENVLHVKSDGVNVKYCGKDHKLLRDDEIIFAWSGDDMTLDSVRPINDRIVVKCGKKEEDTTLSGIALAPGAVKQERTSTGQVVKTGTGRYASSGDLMPMRVEKGDFVKFRDYAGAEVEFGSDKYMVCRLPDCLAKWH